MNQTQEAWHQCVGWYLVEMIQECRKRSFADLKTLGTELSEISASQPLHMLGVDVKFKIKNFGDRELTGGQITALMVATLWCACGERKEMCSSLYETWPIEQALFLIGGPRTPICAD